MKNFLFLIASIIVFPSFAQSSLVIKSYANWEIVNQEAVWQTVFASKLKDKTALTEALVKFLKSNPSIQNLVSSDHQITADIYQLKVDYKKYGGSTTYTPQAFINGLWKGKVVVEIVDGSYDVIASHFSFDVEHKGLNAGNGIMGTADGRGSWTTSVLNKEHTSFKEGKKVDLDLFSKALKDFFDLKR